MVILARGSSTFVATRLFDSDASSLLLTRQNPEPFLDCISSSQFQHSLMSPFLSQAIQHAMFNFAGILFGSHSAVIGNPSETWSSIVDKNGGLTLIGTWRWTYLLPTTVRQKRRYDLCFRQLFTCGYDNRRSSPLSEGFTRLC
ncbi:hypothetical protein BYT27DRAFT_7193268 [Phlegmacium glaucopus]|nr:hypothetical protein BYT27DRAFT_7193268 [Phlegmacium glaucopus]